jgi:hypothetical protein
VPDPTDSHRTQALRNSISDCTCMRYTFLDLLSFIFAHHERINLAVRIFTSETASSEIPYKEGGDCCSVRLYGPAIRIL